MRRNFERIFGSGIYGFMTILNAEKNDCFYFSSEHKHQYYRSDFVILVSFESALNALSNGTKINKIRLMLIFKINKSKIFKIIKILVFARKK